MQEDNFEEVLEQDSQEEVLEQDSQEEVLEQDSSEEVIEQDSSEDVLVLEPRLNVSTYSITTDNMEMYLKNIDTRLDFLCVFIFVIAIIWLITVIKKELEIYF